MIFQNLFHVANWQTKNYWKWTFCQKVYLNMSNQTCAFYLQAHMFIVSSVSANGLTPSEVVNMTTLFGRVINDKAVTVTTYQFQHTPRGPNGGASVS